MVLLEPLKNWKGKDASTQAWSYIAYERERLQWLITTTVQNFNLAERAGSRYLCAELQAISATLLLTLRDTRKTMFGMLKRLMLNSRRHFIWPGVRRQGKTGRLPNENYIVLVTLTDALLAKYSRLDEGERCKVIQEHVRKQLGLRRKLNTIRKVLDRHWELSKIFRDGFEAFEKKREGEIREEVDGIIGGLKCMLESNYLQQLVSKTLKKRAKRSVRGNAGR